MYAPASRHNFQAIFSPRTTLGVTHYFLEQKFQDYLSALLTLLSRSDQKFLPLEYLPEEEAGVWLHTASQVHPQITQISVPSSFSLRVHTPRS